MKKLLASLSIISLLVVGMPVTAKTYTKVTLSNGKYKTAVTVGTSEYKFLISKGYKLYTQKKGMVGASIPVTPALYESSLASPIGSTDLSLTAVKGTDMAGNTLNGYMCFTLDSGSPSVEYVCGTASGTAVTGLLRGIDPITGVTSVSALKFSHRRGTNIKVTDYPVLSILARILNGQDTLPNPIFYSSNVNIALSASTSIASKDYVDNRNGYWAAPVSTFSSLPTGTKDGETRVTVDDSKVYVWSASTSAWTLAGSGGGAGTIYRDDYIATAGQTSFSLSSGSYPAKKYLTVYQNGTLLEEGASADYIASTSGNTIILNSGAQAGEKITMRVESIDFYNANWGQVNTDLTPTLDNTFNIGSSTKRFKDAYIGGSMTVNGSTTFSSIPTIPTTAPTLPGQIIALNASSTLPAVDGSRLTGIQSAYAGLLFNVSTTTDSVTTSTINIGFTPRVIRIHYYVQGHSPFTGDNVVLGRKGIITYYDGLSSVANFYSWKTTDLTSANTVFLSGDDGFLNQALNSFAAFSGGIDSVEPITYPSPSISTGDINASISFVSTSTTGFTFKCTTQTGGGGGANNARCRAYYEAYK